MITHSADHLNSPTPEQRERVKDRAKAFQWAWQRGARPAISTYLPAESGIRVSALIEVVRVDFELPKKTVSRQVSNRI